MLFGLFGRKKNRTLQCPIALIHRIFSHDTKEVEKTGNLRTTHPNNKGNENIL